MLVTKKTENIIESATEGEDKWETLKTLVDAIVNEGNEMGYDQESNENYQRFEAYLAIKSTMDMLEGLD